MPEHARRRLTRRTVLRRTAVGGLALAGGAAVARPLVAGADAATSEYGYRDDGRAYVVGTGADLVFKVDHRNGDLTACSPSTATSPSLSPLRLAGSATRWACSSGSFRSSW